MARHNGAQRATVTANKDGAVVLFEFCQAAEIVEQRNAYLEPSYLQLPKIAVYANKPATSNKRSKHLTYY